MSTRISVLVVDDSDDLATMLAVLIAGEPDLECVGQLPGADVLLETIAQKKPAVVLLDLSMPGRNPLDAMAEASVHFPETRSIVLSGYDDQERVNSALDRGAWGFISKDADTQKILEAVRTVSSGQMYVHRA